MDIFSIAFSAMMIINIVIAVTIIFLERKDSSATLAWLVVLFMLPVIGLLFYITFSQNIARRRIFKMTEAEEKFATTALKKQIKSVESGEFKFNSEKIARWNDLIRLNQVYGRSYYTFDNKIDIITDGKEKFDSLLKDIENAKDSINIEYFIIKGDKIGKKLLKALVKKAKEGIDIKLLVDALGSRSLSEDSIEEFKRAGGKFESFFPTKLPFATRELNYRNHRKIVVIDDNISYVGGFNIAKEYLGLKKKFGYWRDTHLRIEGGATQDLNSRLLLDWRFASKNRYPFDLNKLFFPITDVVGNSGVQIVSSGPDLEHEEIKRAFLKMITGARKRIYIQTPYFVPDATILEGLKMASQSGVDVRVMIPNKPDHMFVYWATMSYVAELMKSGARIFIYDNGFLHAKTMTVDGEVATVGSANFDRRSFRLNFETNAFIFDERVTEKLEEEFEHDIFLSRELTEEDYRRRSTLIKMKEPIARLLSDIL